MQSFLGVDVSKAKLDVALMLANDKFKSKVFSNDIPGFEALVSWLHSQLPDGLVSLHICMESTGSHHEARATLLHSMPGLGEKTMPQLLAYIGRPERFRSVKAVIAHASLTPMIRPSGTSLDKRRGTHPLGHQALKRLLYFPAMVAGRYNPLVAAFWNKLQGAGQAGQAGQGDRGGLHAQAAGNRLRCASRWQALQS